jgi:hypothetical protein
MTGEMCWRGPAKLREGCSTTDDDDVDYFFVFT